MVLVWQGYQSDLGRIYPMFSLSIVRENDLSTTINPLDLLPVENLAQIIELDYPCVVPQLTPRKIRIFASDGARFLLNYYQPFNQQLEDYLVAQLDVTAYEWIGERIKYGRLRRMLDNV